MRKNTPEQQDILDTAAGELVQKKHDEALKKAGISPKAHEEAINELKDQAITARKNRDTDHLMAAAAGFFSMAGGTSPYALKNMADGFGVTVKNVMEAEKSYRASEKDRQASLVAYKQAQRAEVLGLEDKKAASILEGKKAEERSKENLLKVGQHLGTTALQVKGLAQSKAEHEQTLRQNAELQAQSRAQVAQLAKEGRYNQAQAMNEELVAATGDAVKTKEIIERYSSINRAITPQRFEAPTKTMTSKDVASLQNQLILAEARKDPVLVGQLKAKLEEALKGRDGATTSTVPAERTYDASGKQITP
jgi:hypothetical protein